MCSEIVVVIVVVGDLVQIFLGLMFRSAAFFRCDYQCRRIQYVSCISFESVLSNVSASSGGSGNNDDEGGNCAIRMH